MLYPKNVPNWEHILRIISGAVFVGIAILGQASFGASAPLVTGVLLFSAAFVIITGFIGWCPACALVGRKVKHSSRAREKMTIHELSTLVNAASEGDAEAIEQLLLQYQPSITQFARKFCATPEDIEDAVQETLWVVYRKIGVLRTSAAAVSWMFQIVKHYCYRLLRRNHHECTLDDFSHLDDLPQDEQADITLSLRHDVAVAIAHLPVAYRQVLVMRDVESMTASEVAEALGVTIETVKSRLHRGRKLLRERLAHWHENRADA